jgi:hypothetical protein
VRYQRRLGGGVPVAKLFRISKASHDQLVALTAEHDPLYAVLKNGILVEGTVEIHCDDIHAEVLLMAMKVVCPAEAAVNPVE